MSSDERRRRHRTGRLAGPAIALVLSASAALAQQDDPGRSTIREIVIGAPATAQPPDFQDYACGTNGGPPSLPLSGFAGFAQCRPEDSGLREVQFRYDDEPHFAALARGDLLRADFLEGTRFGSFAIVASALIDDGGIVRGVRAVTDDRASNRRQAYSMADLVRTFFGSAGWECTDAPPAEGETPVGGALVKRHCRKLTDDGLVITLRSRLLRRPGQTLVDPVTGRVQSGQYESTSRLEIYRANADGSPDFGGAAAVAEAPAVPAAASAEPREAFLAGTTIDCPGCDLSGQRLTRRNLAGADLRGANLAGATLHRAILAGAHLDGANLAEANLNLTDLKRASLAGTNLTGALLYQADAAAADLSGAVLDGSVAEKARFTSAAMPRIHWQGGNARSANFAGADLTGASLPQSLLQSADLQRAKLAGADLTEASLHRARLRAADLGGATAIRADFLEADLSDANLAGADLSGARLLRARSGGADLSNAKVAGATMPDGTVRQ